MDQKRLPVLVLKNIILFPHSEIRLELENNKDKELITLAESYYNKHILIIHPNDELEESIDKTSFPRIGVIGYINMKIDLPNNKTRLVIRGLKRVKVLSYIDEVDKIKVSEFEEVQIKKLMSIEETAYSRSLIKQVENYIEQTPNISNSILSQILGVNNVSKITDILAVFIPGTYERKLEYLNEVEQDYEDFVAKLDAGDWQYFANEQLKQVNENIFVKNNDLLDLEFGESQFKYMVLFSEGVSRKDISLYYNVTYDTVKKSLQTVSEKYHQPYVEKCVSNFIEKYKGSTEYDEIIKMYLKWNQNRNNEIVNNSNLSTTSNLSLTEDNDNLIADLKKNNFQYIDNREKSGIVWIVHDNSNTEMIKKVLSKYNYSYTFERRGSIVTENKPAWRIMCK